MRQMEERQYKMKRKERKNQIQINWFRTMEPFENLIENAFYDIFFWIEIINKQAKSKVISNHSYKRHCAHLSRKSREKKNKLSHVTLNHNSATAHWTHLNFFIIYQ